jgi:hypothetical protein
MKKAKELVKNDWRKLMMPRKHKENLFKLEANFARKSQIEGRMKKYLKW